MHLDELDQVFNAEVGERQDPIFSDALARWDHSGGQRLSKAFCVHTDELDQVFNSEVGERLDAIFSDAVDPDDAVLDFHFVGDVPEPILVFSEILGDLGNGLDVMDLIDVHRHAAWAEIVGSDGAQFQGSSSSSR